MTGRTSDDSADVAAALTQLGKGASIGRALGKEGKERERPTPPGVSRRPRRVASAPESEHDGEEDEGNTQAGEVDHDDDGVIEHDVDLEEQPSGVVREVPVTPPETKRAPREPARTERAKAPEEFSGDEPLAVREDKRSLSWLNQQHGVGTDNGTQWRIHRLSPQNARGADGVIFKCDGYLGSTSEPIDEEWLRVNHGGGRISCRLFVPDEGGSPRQRTALTVEIAGTPLRPPAQDVGGTPMLTGGISHQSGAAAPQAQVEAPSVVTKAFDVLGATVERNESRVHELREGQQSAIDAQTNLVRQMADERVREVQSSKERELATLKSHYDGLLAERDDRLRDKDRQLEGLRTQIATLSARDPIADVGRLKSSGLLGDGGASHQELMKLMQSSHAEEMARMRDSHRSELAALRTSNESERSSLRDAHSRELASLKESHQRQLDMNDASWKSRLDRADAATETERANARALGDRQSVERKELEERYRARLEDSKSMLEVTATSRYETMATQKDLRIDTLKEENDRLRGDLATERMKNAESGDAMTQFQRAKGMMETMKDLVGGGASAPAPAPSVADRMIELAQSPVGAMIADMLMRGVQAPAGPAPTVQQRPVQQPAPVQRTSLPAPQGFSPLPAQVPDLDDVLEAQDAHDAARDRSFRPAAAQPVQQQPQPQAGQQPQPAPQNAAPQNVPPPAQMMQQFVNHLETAISDGDTPEEFAEEVKQQVPAPLLAALLAQVSATDLQRLIDENHPTSQIASKAGHDFVAKVFKLLGGHG